MPRESMPERYCDLMSESEDASQSSLFIHGSGISALTLAYGLRKDGIVAALVEPEAAQDREHASQHAQCVLHRGYFYATKLQKFWERRLNNSIHPTIATQLYAASLLWESLLAELAIDRSHGMIWLTTDLKDTEAVTNENEGLRSFLTTVLPSNTEHLNDTFHLLNLSDSTTLPWEDVAEQARPATVESASSERGYELNFSDPYVEAVLNQYQEEFANLDMELVDIRRSRANRNSTNSSEIDLNSEKWLGARETYGNLVVELPGVTTFAMDQWVVRPCCVLDRLKDGTPSVSEALFTEYTSTEHESDAISFKALGRSQFSQLVEQPVRTRDHWLLMARGRLPYVNLLLHRTFYDWRIKRMIGALIVSHKCDNGQVVWLIDSPGFDVDKGPINANPSVRIFDEMLLALKRYIRFEPDFSLEDAEWHRYRAFLPELSGLEGGVTEWSLRQNENECHLYNYRFTLAPLVARRAIEVLDDRPLPRTTPSVTLSQIKGGLESTSDLWRKFADRFRPFTEFRDSLVQNSHYPPTI